MVIRHNATGKPLSAARWLEAHHRAKLRERRAFATRLADLRPARIVDLGCATGLWLDLLNDALPDDCEFVGVDGDRQSLDLARARSRSWRRKTTFLELDIEKEADQIPAADLTLAFNVFSYVDNLDGLLAALAGRSAEKGVLIVRQYDGASIRFGPMRTDARQEIETSLRVAVDSSLQFKNYDLDRVYRALNAFPFQARDVRFELFERSAPFPSDFLDYYEGTLDWTTELVSESAAAELHSWRQDVTITARYFFEVDLVAVVS